MHIIVLQLEPYSFLHLNVENSNYMTMNPEEKRFKFNCKFDAEIDSLQCHSMLSVLDSAMTLESSSRRFYFKLVLITQRGLAKKSTTFWKCSENLLSLNRPLKCSKQRSQSWNYPQSIQILDLSASYHGRRRNCYNCTRITCFRLECAKKSGDLRLIEEITWTGKIGNRARNSKLSYAKLVNRRAS